MTVLDSSLLRWTRDEFWWKTIWWYRRLNVLKLNCSKNIDYHSWSRKTMCLSEREKCAVAIIHQCQHGERAHVFFRIENECICIETFLLFLFVFHFYSGDETVLARHWKKPNQCESILSPHRTKVHVKFQRVWSKISSVQPTDHSLHVYQSRLPSHTLNGHSTNKTVLSAVVNELVFGAT